MATVEKNLGGGLCPANTNEADLYTVGASTSSVVTSMMICNLTALSSTFSICHAIAGAANQSSQYLYKNYVIEGAMTVRLDNLRICMATTDKLRVTSGTANALAFNAWGSERAL